MQEKCQLPKWLYLLEMLIVFEHNFQKLVKTRQRNHPETFPVPESLFATWGGAGYRPCGFMTHFLSPSSHSDTAQNKQHVCAPTNG